MAVGDRATNRGRCGYAVNADDNAAKNVGLRACEASVDDESLQPSQTSTAGGVPAGVRLNSGMLTASGTGHEFPAAHGQPSVDGQRASPR